MACASLNVLGLDHDEPVDKTVPVDVLCLEDEVSCVCMVVLCPSMFL